MSDFDGTIDKLQAKELIKSSNGKIFTATFTKKNGEERVMNARKGVKKHLNGGSLPYNPDNKGLVTCFDMQKEGYRMVNIDTLKEVKINGKKLKVK